jgi:toxin CptA
MSSPSFGATIDLALRPSLRALRWIFFAHVVVLALLPFAIQPGRPMLLLAAALAVSWLWLRRHPALGFGPRALTRITWHAGGDWSLQDAVGQKSDAELLGSSYVHPQLLVLNFRLRDQQRRTRVLLGDECESEQLRRLRARLLTGDMSS